VRLVPPASYGYAVAFNAFGIIYDVLLIPNYILGILASFILFGYLKKRIWTIWASLAYAPLALAESIPTFQATVGLSTPSASALIFQASLLAFAATSTASAILMVFDRSRFKQRPEPQPESGK